MKDNVAGTFLFRESGTNPGDYCLSVRKDNKVVTHYRIKKTDSGIFYISQYREFVTMFELVQYYSKDVDGLCTQLTTPCPKTELTSTVDLLQLCTTQFEDHLILEHCQIKLERQLCSGQFSVIWAGMLNSTTPIAAKALKLVPGTKLSEFMAEAQIMKKLQHKNIIKLHGVCIKKQPVYIVTELMQHSSLLDYLINGEGQHLKLTKLIRLQHQLLMLWYTLSHSITFTEI